MEKEVIGTFIGGIGLVVIVYILLNNASGVQQIARQSAIQYNRVATAARGA